MFNYWLSLQFDDIEIRWLKPILIEAIRYHKARIQAPEEGYVNEQIEADLMIYQSQYKDGNELMDYLTAILDALLNAFWEYLMKKRYME